MSSAIQPISVEQFAARFSKGKRWARARMRRMRHVNDGSDMFTTEEWLAEWLAAESVPQQNWPVHNYDPIEEVILSRAIQVIGALARTGAITVQAV